VPVRTKSLGQTGERRRELTLPDAQPERAPRSRRQEPAGIALGAGIRFFG